MSDIRDIRRLLDIMAALRDPVAGCPWDVAQSFASIAPYTIEEAYEVADAIDRGDMADLRDELGDLLLQVAFHAQMAKEQDAFDFGDVVAAICDKMTRRHPHVFAADGCANAAGGRMPGAAGDEARRSNADAQLQHWEDLKRAERAAKGETDASALAGISRGLPEWQRAVKLQHKAAKVGFDWPDVRPVLDKIREEIDEVEAEIVSGDRKAAAEEVGDLLFALANLARHLDVDPEAALRGTNQKFVRRFAHIEDRLAQAGRTPDGASLDEMEALWQEAKTVAPKE